MGRLFAGVTTRFVLSLRVPGTGRSGLRQLARSVSDFWSGRAARR